VTGCGALEVRITPFAAPPGPAYGKIHTLIPAQPTMPDTPDSHTLAAPLRHGPTSGWNGVLAAIDLGSNSFRLELSCCSEGRYRRIDYLKETVRLGGSLGPDRHLRGPAVDHGLACLARFADRLDGFPAERVRAVATQTLREAANREQFLRAAQQALGYPIEVISGEEEARLIYKGVAQLQPGDQPRLVVDIGGRSTELILGRGAEAHAIASYGVGSVSLSRRYFPTGEFTPAAFAAAEQHAGAEFAAGRHTFARPLWQQALGSSGSASAVSNILRHNGVSVDGRITREALDWCLHACLSAGHAERLHLTALEHDRAIVIGGGLAVLRALFATFDIETLAPAKGALRHGLAFDLAESLATWTEPVNHPA
jgi:exopolyphosphatase/guanosine-5'-triphosphate,3'-diphosphate pyrophosphatase